MHHAVNKGNVKYRLNIFKGQEQTSRDTDPVFGVEAVPLPPRHCGQRVLHHHPSQDPTPHPHVPKQPAQRKGMSSTPALCHSSKEGPLN